MGLALIGLEGGLERLLSSSCFSTLIAESLVPIHSYFHISLHGFSIFYIFTVVQRNMLLI